MHLKTPLIFLLLLNLLAVDAANKPGKSEPQQIIELGAYTKPGTLSNLQQYYLFDPAGRILPSEIFSGFHDYRFKPVDFGATGSDFNDIEEGHYLWIRFILYNNSPDKKSNFHLQPFILSSFEEFYLLQKMEDGEIIEEKSGRSIRPGNKPVNICGSDDLHIRVPTGSIDTVYLRVLMGPSSVPAYLNFTIASQDYVISHDRAKRNIYGVFAGIFLIMILYHISLYVRGRESSYLYYILYILSFLVYFVHKEAFIYESILRPNNPNLIFVLLEIFLLFYLLFGISYLDLKNKLQNWEAILQMAVWFSIGGLVINLSSVFMTGMGIEVPDFFSRFGAAILILSVAGCLLLAIVPAYILTRESYQPARYFLIANVFLLLGITFAFRPFLDIIRDNPIESYGEGILFFLEKRGIELGVTLQILTFSIGLSERINLLKIGREVAQRRIIDQLRENAALKDKVNRELEDKVQERTFEIQAQKEHIEKQNKEIKYSFDYAKKIQNTVLPTTDIFETLFGEHFIFFKPRDIVSGDFYWISQSESRVVLTAADCTGHGVPGSLMSMLGITMLHEIVNEKKVEHSDEILNQLRLSIARTLKQEGRIGEQKDGIDMALMIYDTHTRKLEFSGANSPLYIIRNGEMLEYKGNNMPVAFYERMSDFTRYSIDMQKGDRVYMFTDGFPDQFGGPQGKKFKHRPFKELLIEVHDRPMEEQQRILSLIFDEWKGDLGQIDDVLVIGLHL